MKNKRQTKRLYADEIEGVRLWQAGDPEDSWSIEHENIFYRSLKESDPVSGYVSADMYRRIESEYGIK